MKKVILMLLLSFVTASVQASFDGRDMEGRFYFPDLGSLISTDSWTVGPGVEISGFPSGDNRTDLDVSANNITMTYISSSTWTGATQNGPVFEVLNPDSTITGVSINPATSQPGFDISRVSWTGTTITVNWQGLAFTTGQVISLDVTFDGAAPGAEEVPTLNEIGLAILAVLLLIAGFVRFRRHPAA